METIPTSAVTVLSSTHGLQRRTERNIAKKDLQAAVKYGKKEPGYPDSKGRKVWKYTFAGIVYVTDHTSTKEITSWPAPCFGIDVEKTTITPHMRRQHKKARINARNMEQWTSHTVAVVDQSGSMRKTDTSESATRADVVWLTLALDYVGKRLRSGEASETDVFSLVAMRESGDLVLKERPMDWVLYNDLIDLLRNSTPLGAGNYLPALDVAEDLLLGNLYGSCALQLIFLSDGRPSDKMAPRTMNHKKYFADMAKERVGKLASRFGRRLTVGAIAFGEPGSDDFATLKAFADAAKEYGSISFFHPASLSVKTLSKTFTSLSLTLSSTKTELTELGGSRQREVCDVLREPISSLGGDRLTDKWDYFKLSKKGRNVVRTTWVRRHQWYVFPKKSTFMTPEATGVALKNKIFGEGAERMVSEFREVDENGFFVGPLMVGKESRFISDHNYTDLKEFHKIFIKTQHLAQKFACKFNERLLRLPSVDRSTTPTINFLKCTVYMLNHPQYGHFGLLVENMLDIKNFKYQKWNNNDGYVGSKTGLETFQEDAVNMKAPLEEIIEEDENEYDDLSDSEHSEIESIEEKYDNSIHHDDCAFEIADIPQAFSCFTYRYSQRRFLVCDLQGILNTSVSPPIFEMTDPVIHYRSTRQRCHVYGRTDKGIEGIHNFFKTHKCSNLCRMVTRRWLMNPPMTITPFPLQDQEKTYNQMQEESYHD